MYAVFMETANQQLSKKVIIQGWHLDISTERRNNGTPDVRIMMTRTYADVGETNSSSLTRFSTKAKCKRLHVDENSSDGFTGSIGLLHRLRSRPWLL